MISKSSSQMGYLNLIFDLVKTGQSVRNYPFKALHTNYTSVRCSSSDPNFKDNVLWKVAVFKSFEE